MDEYLYGTIYAAVKSAVEDMIAEDDWAAKGPPPGTGWAGGFDEKTDSNGQRGAYYYYYRDPATGQVYYNRIGLSPASANTITPPGWLPIYRMPHWIAGQYGVPAGATGQRLGSGRKR